MLMMLVCVSLWSLFFFFKQKTAYEMRISDWSSDVCSSDLLAVEHRATEALIASSGLRHALLRNGWYTENYTMSAGAEIEHGAVIGSAGDGRISAATRADYAAAAAAVLTGEISESRIYELAGDEGFTLSDYAAALARASGKDVRYVDLPEAEFRAALEGIGVPAPWPAILSESSAKSATGALFDESRPPSALNGRPTTPLDDRGQVENGNTRGRERGGQ